VALLAVLCLPLFWPSPAVARPQVEVALVLAVDSSASVNYSEFGLQMRGIADAFRDPAVMAAIQAAGPNGVAVCVLQWSGAQDMTIVAGWRRIRDVACIVRTAYRFS